jgi:hypothetical protein
VLAHLKRPAEAIEVYLESLTLDPMDTNAVRETMLYLFLDEEMYDEALSHCRGYKGSVETWMLYGYPLVLFLKGRRLGASKEMRKALELEPEVAKALLSAKKEEKTQLPPNFPFCGKTDPGADYLWRFGRFWTEDPLAWLAEVREGKDDTKTRRKRGKKVVRSRKSGARKKGKGRN